MSSTKAFQMALSTTMKKLGLVKSLQNNVRGYFGIKAKMP